MLRAAILAAVAAVLLPAQEFFPLDAVEAGMKATGRTVFAGSEIEEFDVEILGVLENVGPRQSLIVGRLGRRPPGEDRRAGGDERQPGVH